MSIRRSRTASVTVIIGGKPWPMAVELFRVDGEWGATLGGPLPHALPADTPAELVMADGRSGQVSIADGYATGSGPRPFD
jgi:hypothetical protein